MPVAMLHKNDDFFNSEAVVVHNDPSMANRVRIATLILGKRLG
jgi:hypothetical protein